jgi:hypothetical protein
LRAVTASRDGADDLRVVTNALAERFGARDVVLTDSGTSALLLALRIAVGRNGTVAMPAYGCFDLASAAVFAGVRVRLYDLDPVTLSADLDSLRRTLDRGASAVVAVHLYGYPANVNGIRELAAGYGASVIEDAAQGASGSLGGTRLGAFGPLTVLSFGRGKGLTAGSGGALLSTTDAWSERLSGVATLPPRGGPAWGELATAAAQWLIGRPAFYAIPSSIPSLHLGETVYRAAHEPQRMSGVATSLLGSALPAAQRDALVRTVNAERILAGLACSDVRPVEAVAHGVPGYLRVAVRDFGNRAPVRELGIVRGYPSTLRELPQLQANLCAGEVPCPGAAGLRDTLFTLPTHGMLTARDVEEIRGWMQASRMRGAA